MIGGRRAGWAAGALMLAVASLAGAAGPTLAYDIRAGIIVLDAEKAGLRLTAWSEEMGGYFLLRSLERVVLRVPASRVAELWPLLQSVAEVVTSHEPSTRDVREELAAVESGIKSREEALELILGYLEDADVAGTLALEREIAGLMADIERLQGRKLLLENDTAFARVEVTLSSRRQTVPSQRPSSFAWVNGVDLYRFLREVLPYGR